MLFSSHVMQEVSALCDSIVVIARGRSWRQGTPDELRAQTGHDNLEDAFVALAALQRERTAMTDAHSLASGRSSSLRKEFMDSLRDRRALWSIRVLSVLDRPGDHRLHDEPRRRSAARGRATCGSRSSALQHAPALVEWLRQQSGVEVVAAHRRPRSRRCATRTKTSC